MVRFDLNRLLSPIIAWANANSGFLSMISLFFGSGLIVRLFKLQHFKDFCSDIDQVWHSGNSVTKRLVSIVYRIIKYIIKIAARVCLATALVYLALTMILVIQDSKLKSKSEDNVQEYKNSYVVMNSEGPLEIRVLPPDSSRYPEIDMLCPELTNRGDIPWTAVSTTLSSNDPDKMLIEIEEEILKNPLFGDMVLQGFATIEDFSESDMFSDNSGSKSWAEAIYREFQKVYANRESGEGLSHWIVTYKFDDGLIGTYVTDEYRRYAEYICQHLEGYTVLGIAKQKPEIEYHRSYALKRSDLRAMPYHDGETVDALVLSRYADNNNPMYMMGFALDDKRLIIYEIPGRG